MGISSEDTDESLMRRFQAGDGDAFEILFNRYTLPLINYTYRFLSSSNVAEDVVQEVFLRVYRNKERYDASRSFRTWIFSITARLALNEARNRKRHMETSLDRERADGDGKEETLLDRLADPAALPAEDVMKKRELSRVVQAALDALPENQRMAVLLGRYEQMSYEEIAHAINCSVAAVKSLLFRARQTLKKTLASYAEKAGETTQA